MNNTNNSLQKHSTFNYIYNNPNTKSITITSSLILASILVKQSAFWLFESYKSYALRVLDSLKDSTIITIPLPQPNLNSQNFATVLHNIANLYYKKLFNFFETSIKQLQKITIASYQLTLLSVLALYCPNMYLAQITLIQLL